MDRAVPLQARKHSSQECSPGRQTAPVPLQEPSSPLQLALLEIPLLAATKTLFSLFPRSSGDGVFLRAARLSYKAAHTWSGLSCRPRPNCAPSPPAVKPEPRARLSLGHSLKHGPGCGAGLRSVPTEPHGKSLPRPAELGAEGAGMVHREMGTRCCHLPRRGVQEAPSEPSWAVHLVREERIGVFSWVRGRGNEMQQKSPGWETAGTDRAEIPNVPWPRKHQQMSRNEPLQILSAPFGGRFHTHRDPRMARARWERLNP